MARMAALRSSRGAAVLGLLAALTLVLSMRSAWSVARPAGLVELYAELAAELAPGRAGAVASQVRGELASRRWPARAVMLVADARAGSTMVQTLLLALAGSAGHPQRVGLFEPRVRCFELVRDLLAGLVDLGPGKQGLPAGRWFNLNHAGFFNFGCYGAPGVASDPARLALSAVPDWPSATVVLKTVDTEWFRPAKIAEAAKGWGPLKVIRLIRDPRAVMYSRIVNGMYPDFKTLGPTCNDMHEDVAWLANQSASRNFRLLKFSDLVHRPHQTVRRLVEWLEWEVPPAELNRTVREYLLAEKTSQVGGYANNAGQLQPRDISRVDNHWRSKMTSSDELLIQKACGTLAEDAFWAPTN